VQVAGDAAMMAIEPDASVSHRKVQACTGPDETYEITQARYAGTATSRDPCLKRRAGDPGQSVLNTTKGPGGGAAAGAQRFPESGCAREPERLLPRRPAERLAQGQRP
jgi:hypothetical protein